MNPLRATLITLRGLFRYCESGMLVFREGPGEIHLQPTLHNLLGREVDFMVHHFPPNGVDPSLQGGGSCPLGDCCEAHVRDPAWLYSIRRSGVFGVTSEGNWTVDAEPLLFEPVMNGHYGQLVLFSKGSILPGADLTSLSGEASSLIETLSALRASLRSTS